MKTTTVQTIGVLLSLILLSSCAAGGGNIQSQSSNERYPATSDRNDAQTADAVNDPDLYFGDLGVEQLIYGRRVRSLATAEKSNKPLVDPNGFPLIKKFPNPSIRPIKGNYAENVIKTAKSYMGTPYEYGSNRTEPSTFDCSDFTRWVYLVSLGMDLPWDSRSQASYVKAFSKKTYTSLKKAKRGDFLFFTNYRGNKDSDYKGLKPSEKPISHMAIYLGNGKIIHSASKKSGGVRIDDISWRQLDNRFLFGGGILPVSAKRANSAR